MPYGHNEVPIEGVTSTGVKSFRMNSRTRCQITDTGTPYLLSDELLSRISKTKSTISGPRRGCKAILVITFLETAVNEKDYFPEQMNSA